jgi:hypothetical protein
MAKKQKRRVSASPAPETPLSLASERPVAVNPAARASYTQEFNPDYTHINHDLKQIAIMAGSFLVVLVALSFFLR